MTARSSTGPLFDPGWMAFLEPVSLLYATNPFEPAWQGRMKRALGADYVPEDGSAGSPVAAFDRNADRLAEPLAAALAGAARRLADGAVGTPEERAVYQGAALFGLWNNYRPHLQGLIDADGVEAPFFDDFAKSHRFLFGHPGLRVPEPAHLLAFFYQARRAWYFAAKTLLGASPSAMAARAAVLRANLGADICAYVAGLYHHMDEIPVLITGETGTGKDVAAGCIGRSRYIPFDAHTRRFLRKLADDYHVRSLCEVPPELVASALFGHKKGSFTGAIADALGFLMLPGRYGTLFIDEIGEILAHVQAQLLRPFQNREVVPLGEARARKILGRLMFATNRDLEAMCGRGEFRPDLYERMNGVRIHMPPLRQMLAEAPEELAGYVRAFMTGKLDDPDQVEAWTARVVETIRATKGGYAWPRNLRELRNYTERYILMGYGSTPPPPPAEYVVRPQAGEAGARAPESVCVPSSEVLGRRAKAGEVTLGEVARALVTRVHASTGENTAETARKLGIDYRTVQRWVDPKRLARWRKGKKRG